MISVSLENPISYSPSNFNSKLNNPTNLWAMQYGNITLKVFGKRECYISEPTSFYLFPDIQSKG